MHLHRLLGYQINIICIGRESSQFCEISAQANKQTKMNIYILYMYNYIYVHICYGENYQKQTYTEDHLNVNEYSSIQKFYSTYLEMYIDEKHCTLFTCPSKQIIF